MSVFDQIFLAVMWSLWLILAAYTARGVYADLTKTRSK
tara:strand:- start:243 stop:356 length:114 start_codon:yes stop_codon:yes gene_type:complete